MVHKRRSVAGDSPAATSERLRVANINRQIAEELGVREQQVERQLTKTYQGSGLGLAIARSLTNLHGGTMRLRSKLGTGTVVCVSLPRQPLETRPKISAAA